MPGSTSASAGYLDTNVVMHSLTRDGESAECRRFLLKLADGSSSAIVDMLVVHELVYNLHRVLGTRSREIIGDHLLTLISLQGVFCEKAVITDAIRRWQSTPGLSFVDSCLIARALTDSVPIYTKDRGIRAQNLIVPNPLHS